MAVATLGAFLLGEFPEGVAVMLFYTVGEIFQESAVHKARHNIKSLLDMRPATTTVLRKNQYETVNPETVQPGEIIQIKAGEKVPLDGEMLSLQGSFNTSALTGESRPDTIRQGETVLAGMINLDQVTEVKVSKPFKNSSLAKILNRVEQASGRKAKTELLIRKYAKIYTPVVFALASALVIMPWFFVQDYIFNVWFYRALVFLVISCPCALVISIPLGYFGGIGAASRHGILFKGSDFLEMMTKVNTILMNKTGTLTHGVFNVQKVESTDSDKTWFIRMVSSLESKSTHPVARAIVAYAAENATFYKAAYTKEIPGLGLKGIVDGKEIIAGNTGLLRRYGISYDEKIDSIPGTIVCVAIDGKYTGYILIADKIKEEVSGAITSMKANGIRTTALLSGDKDNITKEVAFKTGIDKAWGNLLPEDKVKIVEQFKEENKNVIAFVGNGINDAPLLALSDVGIAMGAIGSDAAIETADVVIQNDHLTKIITAIKIAKTTKRIVIQNIILAFSVKLIVLGFGAIGFATMWEAVFADVGVALLSILNAIRILKMKFE